MLASRNEPTGYTRAIREAIVNAKRGSEQLAHAARYLSILDRRARYLGNTKASKHLTDLLVSLRVKEQPAIVKYYTGHCLRSQGDFVGAREVLREVVETGPPHYRSRALQGIACSYWEGGNPNKATPYLVAAAKEALSHDLVTFVEAALMLAIIRSLNGDHAGAAEQLLHLSPAVQEISRYYPALYFGYLNECAVELGNLGRLDRALRLIEIPLRSQLATTYREWSETKQELLEKKDSSPVLILVPPIPEARNSRGETQANLKRDEKPESTVVVHSHALIQSCQRAIWILPTNASRARRVGPIRYQQTEPIHRRVDTISINPRAPPSSLN